MAWELDAGRVWRICIYDKRVRAAIISYLIASVSTVILEPFFPLDLISYLIMLVPSCILSSGYSQYKYSTQATLLGFISGTSIAIGVRHGLETPKLFMFCLYAWAYSNFHFSEFLMMGLTNGESLRPDSFLLNHSSAYWIAAMASWVEFLMEAFLFPSFYNLAFSLIGISMCLAGEILRKLAMCHASVGFTHQIAFQKRKNHALVTRGIYALCRHPGYLGWLLWSVGTQVILCNPVCSAAYAYVAFNFFAGRIYEEEKYLVEFFGQHYIAYQKRVPTGIPFIHGYKRFAE